MMYLTKLNLLGRCGNNEAMNRSRNSELGPTFNTSRFNPDTDTWPRCIPRVCLEKMATEGAEKMIQTYFEVRIYFMVLFLMINVTVYYN